MHLFTAQNLLADTLYTIHFHQPSPCEFICQVFHSLLLFSFRDMALADAEKKLKNVMKKLDSVTSNFIMEKETWEKNLASVEENWRCKLLILFTSERPPFFLWEMMTKIMNVMAQ
jgi:hypothetical protein